MRDHLTGIRLKLNRAHDQLKSLHAEIDAFFKTKPYRIETQVNPDAREIFGILRRNGRHGTIPPMWSVFIGEIIHNVRSALDHMIWQMVKFEQAGRPSTSTQLKFPIFDTEAGFDSRCDDILAGASGDAKALIKKLQPFYTGEGHASPLWHLHALSNWDKHRNIPLAIASRRSTSVQAIRGEVEALIVAATDNRPLEDDTELFKVRLKPSAVPFMTRVDRVQMKGDLTFHITFKEPSAVIGLQVGRTLNAMGKRVGDIVKRIDEDIF